MSEISREELIGKAEGSLYKLVILAAKRALELAEGAPSLIKGDVANRYVALALEEIAAGKLQCKAEDKKAK